MDPNATCKILIVGDPHIRVEDLDDGVRLIDRIIQVADEQQVEGIHLMGDLFHNHSLVNVEVLYFWRCALERMLKAPSVRAISVILGNHDGPHDMKPGVHALSALEMPGVQIVDKPVMNLYCNQLVLMLPFMRDPQEFVRVCRDPMNRAAVLYCHQEFNGAKYDNGYYSGIGVEPDDIPQPQVISGHIHSGQEFGKIWYVGAPRWLTVSDANQDRFLWVVTHNSSGICKREAFPTDPACQRIVHLQDTQAQPAEVPPGDNLKIVVDVRGTSEWVEERKKFWRGRARVRTFKEGVRRIRVRESEGVNTALRKFFDLYSPPNGTPKDVLERLLRERLRV